MSGHGSDRAAVQRVFRAEHGTVVAALVRQFGDISLAEDAVQEAYVAALRRWPEAGVPPNPAGWIVTTARNRAVDVLRRSARGRELLEQVAAADGADPDFDGTDEQVVHDDRLRLIFTCCHPALRMEHRVALTLRLLGGLGVVDIARSFLVSEAAMARRIGRAKHKIAAANIPYRVPAPAELPDRLASVLAVIYLIYNAGADDPDRPELRAEAIRLGRLLSDLMPDEPEAAGLLALVLLVEARRPARLDEDRLILLRDQDRRRWDRALIEEGQAIVRACIRRNAPGPYQLQAAIHAVHCDAASFADTDWPQILTLYDHLHQLLPSPVVALNRAVALAEVEGTDAGLAHLDELAERLDGYHPFHAVRADLLDRSGRRAEAAATLDRAIELAPDGPERRHLRRRRTELGR